MGYTREINKAELIEVILNCRGENFSDKCPWEEKSYWELEHHKLMRQNKDTLKKLYLQEIERWENETGQTATFRSLWEYNTNRIKARMVERAKTMDIEVFIKPEEAKAGTEPLIKGNDSGSVIAARNHTCGTEIVIEPWYASASVVYNGRKILCKPLYPENAEGVLDMLYSRFIFYADKLGKVEFQDMDDDCITISDLRDILGGYASGLVVSCRIQLPEFNKMYLI